RVLEHDGPLPRLTHERYAILVDHHGAHVGGLGRAWAPGLVIGARRYHHGVAGIRGIDCRLDRLAGPHVQDAGARRKRPSDQQGNQYHYHYGPCHMTSFRGLVHGYARSVAVVNTKRSPARDAPRTPHATRRGAGAPARRREDAARGTDYRSF